MKAHVLVAILGYALWVTLKHLLNNRPADAPTPSASGVDNAEPMTPMKALALLSTLQSADIVLPTTDGRESGCGGSPSRPRSRSRYSGNWESVCGSICDFNANVVQTQQ